MHPGPSQYGATQALSKSRMVVHVGDAGAGPASDRGLRPAHAITTLHYLVSKYQSKNAAATLIISHP